MAHRYAKGYKELRRDLNYCRRIVKETLKKAEEVKDIDVSINDINYV